ncbi:MAG: acyl carrier protein [Candidatus Sulfotelmatobacter sp.]
MYENVLAWLTDWFLRQGRVNETISLSAATDFFQAGWQTSMEVVELVTEIERHFAMQFSEQDLQDARFVTIGGLAELIVERSAENIENNLSITNSNR